MAYSEDLFRKKTLPGTTHTIKQDLIDEIQNKGKKSINKDLSSVITSMKPEYNHSCEYHDVMEVNI